MSSETLANCFPKKGNLAFAVLFDQRADARPDFFLKRIQNVGFPSPRYAKAFRCLGSDCDDTCCHGLDVVVNRASYQKYRSAPAFQARMQHFVPVSHASESRYARIQLTASYTCPFLSPNRLCGIQQEHGDLYLSDVCATYPRLTQRIDGLRETTLLRSCPEAARLVLLNPELHSVRRCRDWQSSALPSFRRNGQSASPRQRESSSVFLGSARVHVVIAPRPCLSTLAASISVGNVLQALERNHAEPAA